MKTFDENETAAKNLPPADQKRLVASFSVRSRNGRGRATAIIINDDHLLQAPGGTPAMAPERVRNLLVESR